MIHIIPHHIAVGSYTRWYEMIEFSGHVKFHEFENKEQIERKLIGEPPYEEELIEHLKQIRPQLGDIVFFDQKYLYSYHNEALHRKLNELSRKFNNCKLVTFDDDNVSLFHDDERFTIFSNVFDVKISDDNKIASIPENCNYYRYRVRKASYLPHLEEIVEKFKLNIRQKKCNLIIGVDKIERLEVFKYFYNIGLDKDSYMGYSGFTSTYDDSEISESLVKFKKEKLPLILDTPFEMSEMGSVNVEIPPLPFTMNSYISCICETQLLLNQSVHLSEKSWNPFISKTIPLILGSSMINQYLKKIGFWMADDLFDISPKFTRVEIINQYKSNLDIINSMSIEDIHEYYKKNMRAIDRNFEHIKQQKFPYTPEKYKSLQRRIQDTNFI